MFSLVSSYAILLVASALLYAGIFIIYRLYYAPVAGFPGPRLAALTLFYEFYYDVWQEGQYTWKIQDLHKEYGVYFCKLVALNPHQSRLSRTLRSHQPFRSSLQ